MLRIFTTRTLVGRLGDDNPLLKLYGLMDWKLVAGKLGEIRSAFGRKGYRNDDRGACAFALVQSEGLFLKW